MAPENTRRGELTQLVPDHVLGDVDRDEFITVVDSDGQAHEFGRDHRAP